MFDPHVLVLDRFNSMVFRLGSFGGTNMAYDHQHMHRAAMKPHSVYLLA